MFNIYFENKIIHIGNHRSFNDLKIDEGLYTYNGASNLMPIFRRLMNTNDTNEIYIINNNEDAFWKDIFTNFKYKEAAGGIVFNEKNEILVIKRYGKWDLPKGGIKKGENSKSAAMREVEEETGIDQLKITDIMPLTFHLFLKNNDLYLKKTYWYKMKTLSAKTPIPQTEEDIEEAKWLNKNELTKVKQNTWDSLLDLWNAI